MNSRNLLLGSLLLVATSGISKASNPSNPSSPTPEGNNSASILSGSIVSIPVTSPDLNPVSTTEPPLTPTTPVTKSPLADSSLATPGAALDIKQETNKSATTEAGEEGVEEEGEGEGEEGGEETPATPSTPIKVSPAADPSLATPEATPATKQEADKSIKIEAGEEGVEEEGEGEEGEGEEGGEETPATPSTPVIESSAADSSLPTSGAAPDIKQETNKSETIEADEKQVEEEGEGEAIDEEEEEEGEGEEEEEEAKLGAFPMTAPSLAAATAGSDSELAQMNSQITQENILTPAPERKPGHHALQEHNLQPNNIFALEQELKGEYADAAHKVMVRHAGVNNIVSQIFLAIQNIHNVLNADENLDSQEQKMFLITKYLDISKDFHALRRAYETIYPWSHKQFIWEHLNDLYDDCYKNMVIAGKRVAPVPAPRKVFAIGYAEAKEQEIESPTRHP